MQVINILHRLSDSFQLNNQHTFWHGSWCTQHAWHYFPLDEPTASSVLCRWTAGLEGKWSYGLYRVNLLLFRKSVQIGPDPSAMAETKHLITHPVSFTIGHIGGGGFILACEEFGRMFHYSFPACTFFFKAEISMHALISLFSQNQSTMAEQAEMTVAERSQTSCVWAHFLIGSPHYAWTAA